MDYILFGAFIEGKTILVDNPLVDKNSREETRLRFSTKMDGGELIVTSNPDYKAKKREEVIIVPRGSEYTIPDIISRRAQKQLYQITLQHYKRLSEN